MASASSVQVVSGQFKAKQRIIAVYNVPESRIDDVFSEYMKFLTLMQKFPNEGLVASVYIDAVFQRHLLDTLSYMEDCATLFGKNRYLHRRKSTRERFERTKQLYEEVYGYSCKWEAMGEGSGFVGNSFSSEQESERRKTVEEVCFESVIEDLKDNKLLGRWDRSVVVSEYKRFWKLCSLGGGFSKTPSKLVDEIWHTHMLQSEKYFKDCLEVFGFYIHHKPHYGEGVIIEGHESDFDKTKKLYSKVFGEAASGKIWGEIGISGGCAGDGCGGGCAGDGCGHCGSHCGWNCSNCGGYCGAADGRIENGPPRPRHTHLRVVLKKELTDKVREIDDLGIVSGAFARSFDFKDYGARYESIRVYASGGHTLLRNSTISLLGGDKKVKELYFDLGSATLGFENLKLEDFFSLETLSFKHTVLSQDLPKFEGWNNLKVLSFTRCRFSLFRPFKHEMFPLAESLQSLELMEMDVKTMVDLSMFKCLKNLTLFRNTLESLSGLPLSLEKLDIRKNRFTVLPSLILVLESQGCVVKKKGNPFVNSKKKFAARKRGKINFLEKVPTLQYYAAKTVLTHECNYANYTSREEVNYILARSLTHEKWNEACFLCATQLGLVNEFQVVFVNKIPYLMTLCKTCIVEEEIDVTLSLVRSMKWKSRNKKAKKIGALRAITQQQAMRKGQQISRFLK